MAMKPKQERTHMVPEQAAEASPPRIPLTTTIHIKGHHELIRRSLPSNLSDGRLSERGSRHPVEGATDGIDERKDPRGKHMRRRFIILKNELVPGHPQRPKDRRDNGGMSLHRSLHPTKKSTHVHATRTCEVTKSQGLPNRLNHGALKEVVQQSLWRVLTSRAQIKVGNTTSM